MNDDNAVDCAEEERNQRIIKQAITHKNFDTSVQRQSMSVPEMAKLLGIKKTDSYYLVHKEVFETRIVGGHMRVMIDSFEKWYRSQFHYKKVTGEKPGAKYNHTLSVPDAAEYMNVPVWDLYCFIKRSIVPPFEVRKINGVLRVDKKSLNEWLDMRARAKEELDV